MPEQKINTQDGGPSAPFSSPEDATRRFNQVVEKFNDTIGRLSVCLSELAAQRENIENKLATLEKEKEQLARERAQLDVSVNQQDKENQDKYWRLARNFAWLWIGLVALVSLGTVVVRALEVLGRVPHPILGKDDGVVIVEGAMLLAVTMALIASLYLVRRSTRRDI